MPAPVGAVPGAFEVDAAGGLEVVPLAGIQAVGGHPKSLQQTIDFNVFDRRVAGFHLPRQFAGFTQRDAAIQPQHLGAGKVAAQRARLQAVAAHPRHAFRPAPAHHWHAPPGCPRGTLRSGGW